MFGITDFGAFCAAILLFLALPGPGTFALLTSTAKGGFRGGAAATLGVIVGDQVLLWLAVDVLFLNGLTNGRLSMLWLLPVNVIAGAVMGLWLQRAGQNTPGGEAAPTSTT